MVAKVVLQRRNTFGEVEGERWLGALNWGYLLTRWTDLIW